MTQLPPEKERRRFPRVNLNVAVRYVPAGSKRARPRDERLVSMGEGGVFIQSKLTYPAGTKLELSFVLEREKISATAFVRYAVAFNPQAGTIQFPGMGVQFEKIDEAAVKRIREYVASERTKPDPAA